MKKRVIFVSQALWIGGIETALINLLNHLDYDKYDVTCLITQDSQEMASRITQKCRLLVADRQHAVSFAESYKHKRLFNLMEEPQHASSLRRFIWRLLRFGLRATEARLYAAYIKRQLDCEHFDTAVIYSDRVAELAVRAVNADKFLMFYHHGAMRREYHDTCGYRKAEKIIAVSDGIAEKLRTDRPQFSDKITVIYNLIDVEGIRVRSREFGAGFNGDKFNIVSCGRLHQVKGYDLAIEACAELVQRGYSNIIWHIVGGGPEETTLIDLMRKKRVEEYVTLLGMQSNPYPYIRAATLFVQPSRFEGYSLSIMESQVLGVPVLATHAAAGQQISDGENGFLCNTDAQSISDAIALLYDNPDKLQNCRKTLKKCNFETLNQAILSQFEELL